MSTTQQLIVIFAFAFFVALFALLFYVLRSLHRLTKSFAKLGYVTREDAKKYFGDAADKVVDMNTGFNAQMQEQIEQAMKQAISASSAVVGEALAKAEQQATNVILKAQEQASQITAEAKKKATHFNEQAVSNAVDAIAWALQEYIRTDLAVSEHEAIITQLIEKYVNERTA